MAHALRQRRPGRADLRIRLTVQAGTTRLAVDGRVDAHGSGVLSDALELARIVRPQGPIVVDFSGTTRLAAEAMRTLQHAASEADHAGRVLAIRHLSPGIIANTNG